MTSTSNVATTEEVEGEKDAMDAMDAMDVYPTDLGYHMSDGTKFLQNTACYSSSSTDTDADAVERQEENASQITLGCHGIISGCRGRSRRVSTLLVV